MRLTVLIPINLCNIMTVLMAKGENGCRLLCQFFHDGLIEEKLGFNNFCGGFQLVIM